MIDWRRQLGMVPRELRDRVPKHLQWRFNEHMTRLAQDPKRAWRHPTLGWSIPSRLGSWQVNGVGRFIILLGWFIFGVMSIYALSTLAPMFGLPSVLAPIVVLALFWIGMVAIRGSATPDTSETERLAWRALNIIGLRTCEACGYDCQSIDINRCPECGNAVPEIEPATDAASSAKTEPPARHINT
jgi:hypothetical protein